MVQAVLFDFDLTLADSTAGATECCNFALRALGRAAATEPAIRSTIGLPLGGAFAILTGSVDPREAAEFARHFVKRADEVMADLIEVYPCVPGVLAALRARGARIGIVSTKFRYRIHQSVLRTGLDTCVDAIVGREDVPVPKPHPAGIIALLSMLGLDARRAVYVGDHPVDAAAASAAGMAFIGVLTGATDRAHFADIGVHHVLESVADVAAHFLLRDKPDEP